MNNLSVKQLKAIPLLAQGQTGKQVSKEISVAPQTICEWKKLPEFIAQVNEFTMETLEKARAGLQCSTVTAVAVLSDLAENSKSDETRRKAALDILRMTGFDAGLHESFGWGVGSRTSEGVRSELNGTSELQKLIKGVF